VLCEVCAAWVGQGPSSIGPELFGHVDDAFAAVARKRRVRSRAGSGAGGRGAGSGGQRGAPRGSLGPDGHLFPS
jgi:hypothetical protein